MRKLIIMAMAIWGVTETKAQPRPYEIDNSFEPTLEFLNQAWEGTYDGLEPNSRMIVTVQRTLQLRPDMTYSNETLGTIKGHTATVVLKREEGTYTYDDNTHTLTYVVMSDSTLDINTLLQATPLVYEVHHHTDDEEARTNTEYVQFTPIDNRGERRWIAFDYQLYSPVDPMRQAVYTLTGSPLGQHGNSIESLTHPTMIEAYDIVGRKIKSTGHKVLRITTGKKTISY